MSPADRAACGEACASAVPTSATPRPEVMSRGCSMPSLAMVYAKLHAFEDTYAPAEALSRGTLFRALDMPFTAGGRK